MQEQDSLFLKKRVHRFLCEKSLQKERHEKLFETGFPTDHGAEGTDGDTG